MELLTYNDDGISVDYCNTLHKAYTKNVETKQQTYIYSDKPFSVAIIVLIFMASGRFCLNKDCKIMTILRKLYELNWKVKVQIRSCHSETRFPNHDDELLLPVNMEFKYYFQVLNVGNTLHYVSVWYQLQPNSAIMNLLRDKTEPRSFIVAQTSRKVQEDFNLLFLYKLTFSILGHLMPWNSVFLV